MSTIESTSTAMKHFGILWAITVSIVIFCGFAVLFSIYQNHKRREKRKAEQLLEKERRRDALLAGGDVASEMRELRKLIITIRSCFKGGFDKGLDRMRLSESAVSVSPDNEASPNLNPEIA